MSSLVPLMTLSQDAHCFFFTHMSPFQDQIQSFLLTLLWGDEIYVHGFKNLLSIYKAHNYFYVCFFGKNLNI